MKKVFYILSLMLVVTLSACSEASMDTEYESGGRTYGSEDGSEGESPGTEEPATENQVSAGQLTASEWNDLENYDLMLELIKDEFQSTDGGIFAEYYQPEFIDLQHMIKVTVQNDTENLSGALVEVTNSSGVALYTATTNARGEAYLFPTTYVVETIDKIQVYYGTESKSVDYSYGYDDIEIDVTLTSEHNFEDVIEIMFVIDATGSMRDEMDYLKAEIENVIDEIAIQNPTSTIKLALLFYKDLNEDYVVRYFEFSENIEWQKDNLADQRAGGGGDFPEAVDVALEEAVAKSWSDSNSTKIIFHVLDAPPHSDDQSMQVYSDALKMAASKGIRIIPVASSGIDKFTEYLLRSEAMLTGGTYVFLTNDSGIGGDHIDATVGETEVEYLNAIMIRLVTEYHTGVEGTVVPYYEQ